jgi:RNA polymerase sigma-70 factor (ECF subfamily)
MSEGELSRIFEAYHGRVVAYAAKLIGRDGADDIAAEVFIKVGRALDALSDEAKLTSWIYAITLNSVRDAARARASREAKLVATRDSGERTPEETALRNEMVACYLDHVRQLPRSYYDVYALSELEELSNAEIAARLSISVGAVKIRLHRARARLHEALRSHCRCYVNDRGELMAAPK